MRPGDFETLRLGGAERFVLGVFCFFAMVALGLCAGVTLCWDANTEPDVAGYRIYERCSPASVLDLSSPFTDYTDVGNVTTWRTEASTNTFYYFRATCYNTSGLESDFSNMIFVIFAGPE